jgi:flagellin-specific chaperone FliS
MTEPRNEHKYRIQNGETPAYKQYHEVHITDDLTPTVNDEIVAFIDAEIVAYKGKTEDKHGIPLMLFERKQDAQKFADALMTKFKIQKKHIAIKAQKFTR